MKLWFFEENMLVIVQFYNSVCNMDNYYYTLVKIMFWDQMCKQVKSGLVGVKVWFWRKYSSDNSYYTLVKLLLYPCKIMLWGQMCKQMKNGLVGKYDFWRKYASDYPLLQCIQLNFFLLIHLKKPFGGCKGNYMLCFFLVGFHKNLSVDYS